MKHLAKIIAILIFMAVAATAVYAKFNKAQDAIRYRQAVMVLVGQHFGNMGEVVKGKQPYNQDSFAEEATILEMLSKMPWDAFLYPASDRGKTKLNSKALKKHRRLHASRAKIRKRDGQAGRRCQNRGA